MSQITLRPNAVVTPDSSSVTGTGSAADVTNDDPDDDATYFSKSPGYAFTVLEMESDTLNAGDAVKLLVPRFRVTTLSSVARGELQLRTGNSILTTTPFSATTTVGEQTAQSYANATLTQTQLNGLRIAIRGTQNTVRISEVYLDLTIAEQPTTTVNGPTGTVSTSRPQTEWQHTAGVDGGPQVAWRNKIFSAAQYQAPTFDPDFSKAVYSTSGAGSVQVHTPSVSLAHNQSYRTYVQTAQLTAGRYHWSEWDFESFTVDLIAPEIDALVAVPDSAFARVAVDVSRASGDAWDHIELQRMSAPNLLPDDTFSFTDDDANGRGDDWDSDTSGTVSTTFSKVAGYQRMAVTGIGAGERQNLQVGELVPVVGGEDYLFQITARAPTMGSFSGLIYGIRWFDSQGNHIAHDEEVLTPLMVSSSARHYAMSGTARDLAAYGAPIVGVIGLSGATSDSTTAEFVYAWMSQGSDDDLWVDVVGAAETEPPANDVTILDFGAPGNRMLWYRARAVDANDNAGDWFYETGGVEWEQTETWVKSPSSPGFNTQACIAVRPRLTWPRRRGVHRVLESRSPVVITGPRQLRQGVIEIETETLAEYQAIMNVLDDSPVLFQFHPEYGLDQLWGAIGDIEEEIADERTLTLQYRRLFIDVVEVEEP